MAKKIKVDPKKVKKEELQGIFSKVLDKLKSQFSLTPHIALNYLRYDA